MKSTTAYEKILNMILTGEKLPGTRLVLLDLEKELGIGRGPIREAIIRLDSSGLVKNVPYKGAFVTSPPSVKEIYIFFEIRTQLETQLLSEALKKCGHEHIAEMEDTKAKMTNKTTDYFLLNREFHNIFYRTAGLPHILETLNKLIASVETFLTLRLLRPTDCQKMNTELGNFFEAINRKDTVLAEKSLHRNIENSLNIVERTFP